MRTVVRVENIQCGRCTNSILKDIGEIRGVFSADLDYANGQIWVDHTDEVSEDDIITKLKQLGYAVRGVNSGSLDSQSENC